MKPKRQPKPFTVERKAIKGDNNPRRTPIDWSKEKPSHPYREEHEAFLRRQQELAREIRSTSMLLQINAAVEKIRRSHNSPDDMHAIGVTYIKGEHAEKVEKLATQMVAQPGGVFVPAMDGCEAQLKLHMSLAMPGLEMRALDTSMPSMPRGLRAFIKNIGRDE
jgi:hypothetical protein